MHLHSKFDAVLLVGSSGRVDRVCAVCLRSRRSREATLLTRSARVGMTRMRMLFHASHWSEVVSCAGEASVPVPLLSTVPAGCRCVCRVQRSGGDRASIIIRSVVQRVIATCMIVLTAAVTHAGRRSGESRRYSATPNCETAAKSIRYENCATIVTLNHSRYRTVHFLRCLRRCPVEREWRLCKLHTPVVLTRAIPGRPFASVCNATIRVDAVRTRVTIAERLARHPAPSASLPSTESATARRLRRLGRQRCGGR
jgi:hypothetical protein